MNDNLLREALEAQFKSARERERLVESVLAKVGGPPSRPSPKMGEGE